MEFTIPKKPSQAVKVKFLNAKNSSVLQKANKRYSIAFRDSKEELAPHLSGITVLVNEKDVCITKEYARGKGVKPKSILLIKSMRCLKVKWHERDWEHPNTQSLLMAQLWHHDVKSTASLLPDDMSAIIKEPLCVAHQRFGDLKLLRLKSGIDWLIDTLGHTLTRDEDTFYNALVHLDKLYALRKKSGNTRMSSRRVHPHYFEQLLLHHLIATHTGPTTREKWVALGADAYNAKATKRLIETLWEHGGQEVFEPQPGESDIQLDPRQQAAIDHIKKNPIVIIEGGPGTGKTQLDVEIRKLYPQRVVVSLMFLGTLVKERQKRVGSKDTVMTIHRAYYGEFEEVKRAEIAIVDEFSNVDSRLFLMLLQSLPNLKRLVILQDRNQIPPIKPGSPALAMVRAYPKHCFKLTKNFRVHEGAKMIKELNDNINYHCPQLAMKCFKLSPYCKRVDWPAYQRWEWQQHAKRDFRVQVKSDAHMYDGITGEFIATLFHSDVDLKDVESWQTLTFRNVDVDALNFIIEDYLLEHEYLPWKYEKQAQEGVSRLTNITIQMGRDRPDLRLYRGKKICMTETFQCKDASLASRYDEMRNGAIVTIDEMRETRYGQEIITTCGLCFLLHSGIHVKPRGIRSAFCVTVNRSLGSEYEHAMVFVPPVISTSHWTCEYLYVACSRAKRSLVCVSHESKLYDMIVVPGPTRETYAELIL